MPKNCAVKAFNVEISDIHTHNPLAPADAVINLERYGAMRSDHNLYSVGWHPWWPEPDMEWVRSIAVDPRVAIIGECGVDRRRGIGTISEQLALTEAHARLSEELGKPLLLHIVGAWSEIIALRNRLKPTQKWIIHGFRGKPQLATQLLNAGFDISLGQHFNPATAAAIPADRRHHETD